MTQFFNRPSEKHKRRRLRSQMPLAEAILWSKLKGRKLLNFKLRCQYSVGPYLIDFYCPELKLGIELDGESHYVDGAPEYDAKRTRFIEGFGIRLLRFLNQDVYENLDGVWDAIVRAVQERSEQFARAQLRAAAEPIPLRRGPRSRAAGPSRATPPAPPF